MNLKKVKSYLLVMCKHSDFNHQLYLSCCQKYFDCTYCHREYHQGKNVQNIINHIKCNKCQKQQSRSNECIECKTQFAEYYCKICGFWCNSKIFHCHECECCYQNIQYDLIHCHECNKCINSKFFDKHKCHLQDKNPECQVCFESSKTSNKEFLNLPCNHNIHRECYHQYKKICQATGKSITCGICRSSI